MEQQSTRDTPTAAPGDRFTPTPAEIAALAYEFWNQRHSPIGSPDEDWFRAELEFAHRRTPGSAL